MRRALLGECSLAAERELFGLGHLRLAVPGPEAVSQGWMELSGGAV